MKNCIFSGVEIDDNRTFAPDINFKKMCLNCKFVHKDDDGTIYCFNEKNKAKTKEEIIKAAVSASTSYVITNLDFDLAPVALKKPTLKCGEWELSEDVLDLFKKSFT